MCVTVKHQNIRVLYVDVEERNWWTNLICSWSRTNLCVSRPWLWSIPPPPPPNSGLTSFSLFLGAVCRLEPRSLTQASCGTNSSQGLCPHRTNNNSHSGIWTHDLSVRPRCSMTRQLKSLRVIRSAIHLTTVSPSRWPCMLNWEESSVSSQEPAFAWTDPWNNT